MIITQIFLPLYMVGYIILFNIFNLPDHGAFVNTLPVFVPIAIVIWLGGQIYSIRRMLGYESIKKSNKTHYIIVSTVFFVLRFRNLMQQSRIEESIKEKKYEEI